MFSKLNPAAAAVGALLMALAFTGVTQALAQVAPTSGGSGPPAQSTTCGAGTIEKCSTIKQEICDWKFEVTFDPKTGSYGVKIGKTDCKPGGDIPIYKDMVLDQSIFSGACDLLRPFLGMPAGSGCKE
jgi:hypothetical protein